METRPGRFEVDPEGGKTMRVGTDIYREIIKKMLSVHIATMERKMRACQRCPPRCPALPEGPNQEVEEHPYTKPYKEVPFIPRAMLPSYIQLKIAKQERKMGKNKLRTEEEAKTREEYEAIEDKIRQHKGIIAKAKEAEKDARVILQAQIDSLQALGASRTKSQLWRPRSRNTPRMSMMGRSQNREMLHLTGIPQKEKRRELTGSSTS